MQSSAPNERQSIQNLQRYLRQLSFDHPQIDPPPEDGIFDTATRDALRAYQQISGLPSTGRADLETWNRLFSDYRRSLERNRQGEGFYIFPRMPIDYVLEPDGEQFLVTVVQYILNELRVLYDDIPLNEQGGRYDEVTRQGVTAFQRRNGLDATGLIDRATWNALSGAHRRLTDRGEI